MSLQLRLPHQRLRPRHPLRQLVRLAQCRPRHLCPKSRHLLSRARPHVLGCKHARWQPQLQVVLPQPHPPRLNQLQPLSQHRYPQPLSPLSVSRQPKLVSSLPLRRQGMPAPCFSWPRPLLPQPL